MSLLEAEIAIGTVALILAMLWSMGTLSLSVIHLADVIKEWNEMEGDDDDDPDRKPVPVLIRELTEEIDRNERERLKQAS